ncbi:universal stress protein [Candidatus Nitrososphaera sp. FF02]|uniref:universal stress protein n=1 Tax=Candidatus Nitrososphaera sp. FF02 TaxID=3398226 RepID=UPI0039E79856
MYTKILAPYDASKYSDKAIEHAIALAKMSGAKLTFVNVTMLPTLIYSFYEPANTAINEAAELLLETSEDSATKAMHLLVTKAKKQGVEASYVHAVGDPAEIIIETAKRKKVDLIVMGSRGLHGLARIKALGSVTRRVVEHAECPILIVH